ncbi:hypothetical protein GCM10010307_06570 [Streptomyces vastus]|uniref:Uncharacterized protein n=1 Tax=Streptomyces vastus TaxID=285451 RepID=A0ABP6CJS8_9ACTN
MRSYGVGRSCSLSWSAEGDSRPAPSVTASFARSSLLANAALTRASEVTVTVAAAISLQGTGACQDGEPWDKAGTTEARVNTQTLRMNRSLRPKRSAAVAPAMSCLAVAPSQASPTVIHHSTHALAGTCFIVVARPKCRRARSTRGYGRRFWRV